MKQKKDSMHQPSSPRMLEANLDYEYLKTKNNELCQEVASLRKDQTKKQADIDYLLREKFNIEFQYNQLFHNLTNIEKRSKLCLNHIVDCSTELTQIMQLTSRVKKLGSYRLSDSPVSTSRSKNNSFKQVVTPHAVNGHVLHTPTIRIARYSEPSTQNDLRCSSNHAIEQNYEDDNFSSEDEGDENDGVDINEEDPGNGTFETRGLVLSNNSDLDCLEEDVLENDNDEDAEAEGIGHLSPIMEELEESSNQYRRGVDEEQPVFSGRFQEVRIYLNQHSEKNSRINNKRGSNNSSDLSDVDKSVSSVVPEASTSFDVTTRFNESLPSQVFTGFFEGNVGTPPKRKSLVERKSIGSPIPSKISRRSGGRKRRFSAEISDSPSTRVSSSPSDRTQEFRRSFSSFAESSESTLKNCSSQKSKRQIESSVMDLDQCGAANSNSILVPTISSFIEKTSIHSTPSFDPSHHSSTCENVTPFISKVNVRKIRSKKPSNVPVVHLTRLELSHEETEYIGLSLKKLSKKNTGTMKKILREQNIKREKSDTKKSKVDSKSSTPSSPKKVVISKVKRDKSPDITDATIVSGRPKRAAKPTLLKEPNLSKKLRRSR